MDIRLAGLTPDSIVDGPGLRLAIFTQGCVFCCPGCHNQQAQALEGGTLWDTQDILKQLDSNPLLGGITLSGGEPTLQAAACALLAQGAKQRSKSVWMYTGNTLEALMAEADADVLALLQNVDVLVDGPFEQDKRTLELAYRGSKNQRLIDVQKSLATGQVVLHELPSWF